MSAFAVPRDGTRSATAVYTVGSGSLTVTAGDGSKFGTPTPTTPISISRISAATYAQWPETYCHYLVTGVSGDTFTGLTVIGGTDFPSTVGDIIEMRITAKHVIDIQIALGQPAIAAPASPVTGDLWLDSTQMSRGSFTNGMIGYLPRLIYSQVANVTQTAAAASSLVSTVGALGSVSLPAGFLNVAGKRLRLKAGGYATTAGSAQGNGSFVVKLGSNIIASTGAIGLVAGVAAQGWVTECDIVCKATGASGKLDIAGSWQPSSLTAVLGNKAITNSTVAGTIVPGTQITLDLTAAYIVDFLVNLSAAVNSFTCVSLSLEELG